jgi:hypothetical protein
MVLDLRLKADMSVHNAFKGIDTLSHKSHTSESTLTALSYLLDPVPLDLRTPYNSPLSILLFTPLRFSTHSLYRLPFPSSPVARIEPASSPLAEVQYPRNAFLRPSISPPPASGRGCYWWTPSSRLLWHHHHHQNS